MLRKTLFQELRDFITNYMKMILKTMRLQIKKIIKEQMTKFLI